jgi:uncharacterized protein (DUF488 family)
MLGAAVAEIFTIGHSTRPIDEFLALLAEHAIEKLVDVRTVPRSRHNPQFNADALPEALERAGIAYTHRGDLGGLRHARKDSPNTAWRNASFRGYADYMTTPEFERALEDLIALAGRERIAVMCAEAVPWRCHRSLIADALTARGIPVIHIMSPAHSQPHVMTSFAHVAGARVTYPGNQLELGTGSLRHPVGAVDITDREHTEEPGGPGAADHRKDRVGAKHP